MNLNRLIWLFSHTYIKHELIGMIAKSKYGFFGKDSRLYKPYIYDNRKQNIYIGTNTHIGPYSRMQTYQKAEGKYGLLKIGNNCRIGQRVSFLVGEDIIIEDDNLIASDVLITSENHSNNPESVFEYMSQKLICKPVTIQRGCWIGEKVCILPGVTIGEKSIIGASSVVTKNIPAYSIAVGNPAKVIKKYDFLKHKWSKSESILAEDRNDSENHTGAN